MGKNKGGGGGGKKPSVFKVAGAKSLKAKLKAKPVTGNLKKINEIVRNNIDKIDKSLGNLKNDLRQKNTKKKKVNPNSNNSKNLNKSKEAADLEKEKEKAIERLHEMQF